MASPAPSAKELAQFLIHPVSSETSAFCAADEKVIAQLRARFSRSET